MTPTPRGLFWPPPDHSLDRQYLRVCAVHRLLNRRRIGFARAVELLAERRVVQPARLVELWRGSHLREMAS